VNKGDHFVSNVEHVLTIQDELSACPLWDSAEQALSDGANFYLPNTSLFPINPDGSVHQFRTGFATFNRPGLSSVGKTRYFVNTFHYNTLAYAYTPVTGGSKIAEYLPLCRWKPVIKLEPGAKRGAVLS
jgi:hypothetical protein